MQQTTHLTAGQRIEHLRRSRGISRRDLAAQLGYSDEWLRQVERKGRPVERVSTLVRLAEILQLPDASALLDHASPGNIGSPRSEVLASALREAILSRWTPWQQGGGPDPLTHQDVADARQRWCDSARRYTTLLERLPILLGKSSGGPDAQTLRAGTFQLASRFLLRTGDVHFAQIAADCALAELETRRGSADWFAAVGQVAEVLLRSGSPADSRRLAAGATQAITRTAYATPETVVRLYATEAEAAAATGDRQDAQHALARARDAAASPRWSAVTDVAAIRVELALGRADRAIRLADNVEDPASLCRGMRSTFYLTLAAAHLSGSDVVATAFALLQVEQIYAEEIRFDAQVHSLLASALTRDNMSVRHELGRLAEIAQAL